MTRHSVQPIGVFDSGVGGLTVAKALTDCLPKESIVYFGDTLHTPWGDKSAAAIQAYSIKICDLLLLQNCKLILIACNSASAVAYELVKDYVGNRAIVIDVIDPMIKFLSENYTNKTIGLIGTKRTIASDVYRKKLDQEGVNILLKAMATPLLVPLIEEAAEQMLIQDAIKHYLSAPIFADIDVLVLGCTHYPLIRSLIREVCPIRTDILDSIDIVAKWTKKMLTEHALLSNATSEGQKKFYVSDYTPAFSAHARLFFKGPVCLEKYPLWQVYGEQKVWR